MDKIQKNNDTKKFYAQYYKCALQVNPYNYSKFRGKDNISEEDYNQGILDECIKNNIKVVGLADHGNCEDSEGLRKKLSSNNILTFPGFEISSAEKIHMVCLFPPEYKISRLNKILGQVGLPTEIITGTESSSISCIEIAKKIYENDGFWYAAHITGDNGILKIGKMNHVWVNELLSVAQIPNSLDNIDPKFKNIIKNTDSSYKRNKPVAYINSSDIESPSDLSKKSASVLVKMSKLSFDAFKIAFKDSDSRIKLNFSNEKCYKSSIDELKINGGYLDGLDIAFSNELSSIIGGRGTGKSTLINLIIYCLDQYHSNKEFKKYIESFAEANLGTGGEVKIKVTSYEQNGLQFEVSKRYKQNVIIKNLKGEILKMGVNEIFPNIEIYAQNELIEVIKSKDRMTESIHRLINIKPEVINQRDLAYKNLKNNTLELISLSEKLEKLKEDTSNIPVKKSQLEFYNSIDGLEDILTPIAEIVDNDSKITELINTIEKFHITDNKIIIEDIIKKNTSIKNNEILQIKDKIEYFNSKSIEFTIEHNRLLEQLLTDVHLIQSDWGTEKECQEASFKNLFKDIPAVHDKSSKEVLEDYRKLVSEISSSEPIVTQIEHIDENIDELESSRKNILENCKNANNKYIQAITRRIKTTNKSKLKNIVELKVDCMQNKDMLINELKKIDGIGDKSLQCIVEYQDFDLITFIENVRKGAEKLTEEYKLTKTVAEKIQQLDNRKLWNLEEMILGDITNISLKVGNDFKKMEKLSKGQQCTALLNILLVENKDPLIIDQPEDNLDNAYIADSLVTSIRNNKVNRQYIFATHNANIPVFGDAELILGLTEENGKGRIYNGIIGSIDNQQVMKQVVDILEGGETAFKIRKEKYQF